MCTGKRQNAGFSLVELLIVISLMGILAGIVLPHFNPGIHEQLQASAQIVAADLSYARDLAVTNDSSYRISFDVAENQYTLEHSGANPMLDALPPSPFQTPGGPPDRQTSDLDEMPHTGPTVYLAAVHRMTAAPQLITDVEFGPLGETTRAEETVIWLACGTADSRRYIPLHVDPVTGLASIGQFSAAGPPLAQAPPAEPVTP